MLYFKDVEVRGDDGLEMPVREERQWRSRPELGDGDI